MYNIRYKSKIVVKHEIYLNYITQNCYHIFIKKHFLLLINNHIKTNAIYQYEPYCK